MNSKNSRTGLCIRVLLAVAALGLIFYWLGSWLHFRATHVHVMDARIKTDMVAVASRLPGWVVELQASEGDVVIGGQTLAVVDSAAAELGLQTIAASRKAEKADRSRIKAELDLQVALDKARLVMAQKRVESSAVLVEKQQLALAKARKDLNRVESLASAMVSAQQLADARYRTEDARVSLRLAVAEQVEAQVAVANAEAQQLNQKILARRLDAAETRLEQLEVERQRLQLEVDDRRLRSPIDGVLARSFVDTGEYVQAGQNLLMLHNPENIWVEANVKETALARVKLGQQVAIRVDAYPEDKFIGSVERIGSATTGEFALLPSPNPSGNFTKTTQRVPLRIAFAEPDSRLRPGMMVEVSIDVLD